MSLAQRQPGQATASALLLVILAALLALIPGPGAAASQGGPSVTGVAVTSTPASGDTYALGETIRVTLTFSEAVAATGTPRLKIDMDPADWGEKWANYESGSGTPRLTFTHEVVEPNYSSRGIALLANTLELNGGSIRSASSQTDAGLSHTGLDHDARHKVNWRLSPPAPTVTFVAVSSVPGGDGAYALGQTIRVTLSFSEPVEVTGTPQLAIDMDPADWGRKTAAYESGSGSSGLTFAHTVVEPNFSSRGIAVLADTLELNGGSIESASSKTAADLSHTGLDHDANHKVNWRLPPPEPKSAPVVNTGTRTHERFTSRNNAPRGFLVSKSFADLFSDPDGDRLTYAVSISAGRAQLVEDLAVGAYGRSDLLAEQSPYPREATMRVFFEADANDDWDAIVPALPERPVITVTLTATDPSGLSASVRGDFLIHWEPRCELASPEGVSALGVARAAVAFWRAPASKACEPIGYEVSARSVAGGPWTTGTAAPEARSHVLEDLTPGLVEYQVLAVYPEGTSERPPTLPQTTVPEACDITLTVEANVDRGISGTWTNVAGTPSGCVFGPEIEYEFKESTHDYFRNYGRFPNWPPADQPSFISYDLKPGVTYDFRIVAVDAAGRKNQSNVASATVVYDVDAAVDANSPGNLRVQSGNHNDAFVSWSDPESFGAGRTLTTYVVEWKTGATASTANVARDADGNNRHRITGLTNGSVYTVRVAARTSGSSPASQDAWTAPSPPFTAWSEPTQLWFADGTPSLRLGTRVSMQVEPNKAGGAIACTVAAVGPPIVRNCPAGSFITVQTTSPITSTASITATMTLDGETTSSSAAARPGGPGGFEVRASAGADPSDDDATTHEGKIAVGWESAPTTGFLGTLRDYWVGYQDTDLNWTSATKATTERSHTFTGIAPGTYRVIVVARSVNTEDHDGNPLTPDEPVTRAGSNAAVITVTVDAGHTATPGRPTHGYVTPGVGSLIVGWEPPHGSGSAVYGYQVRHRPSHDYATGGPAWTEGPVIYPRPTQRICHNEGCVNPRRYEITGLGYGKDYDVEVRAINANGPGGWIEIATQNITNGIPPLLDSAAVNGTALTLTFTQTLDTDSKPAASAFTVRAGATVVAVNDVGISGKVVTLTLGAAVTSAQAVRVSYVKPAEKPLQHKGAPASSFRNQAVINNTP